MKGRVLSCLLPLLLLAACAAAQTPVVTVLTLDGPIDQISARYLLRGLDRAQRDRAALAVIELDTPGGLGVSMDDIVARILASPVPVAVWVAPQGARAASAGAFIAMAAHVAAMAPGTHIGAAHPVDSGGGDIQGAMGDKILNDAVADLKSLALLRGRDPAWADDAVRRSLAITDTDALARHVVDLRAPSLADLLAGVDGRVVKVSDGSVTLSTSAVEIRALPMTFVDRFLGYVVNADLAYILLVLGILGIIFELTSPGAIAPGVAGALCLLVSFIAFGSLPTNIGGIVFLVLAVALFIVDLKAPTHGILTAGGVVAFVMGSLLLFPPWRGGGAPSAPAAAPFAVTVSISPWLIACMTVVVTGFFVFVLAKGIAAQRGRRDFGAEALPGREAVAVTALAPEGIVRSRGEQWSAAAEEGPIEAGDTVQIIGREGLRLLVRRSPYRRSTSQGGS